MVDPFTLELGDNVGPGWAAQLALASRDWSRSKVLDTVVVPGAANPQACRPTVGRVEVCAGWYGLNNWLGLATIWISGSHIYQGRAMMNDTWFSRPRYNTTAWKNLVMCQEVGHTFGLGHQDENFSNEPLGTCMDYSADPEPNQHPNRHDYDQLEEIYAHLDGSTTVGAEPADMGQDFTARSSWGRLVATTSDGSQQIYERDFGSGFRVVTFVTWPR